MVIRPVHGEKGWPGPKHRHQIRLAATGKTNWVSGTKNGPYPLDVVLLYPHFSVGQSKYVESASNRSSSVLLVEGIKNHENCTCGYHSSQNNGVTPFANICSLD